MRAALLLIPFAALAAFASAGGQDDESMTLMNGPGDMDMQTVGNSTEEAPPRPAWLSGHMWLWAGEEPSGSVWYFDPFESDFTARPHRVVLRIDETPDAASSHNNTLRVAEIDCAGHRYRILRTTHYDDAGNASEANERGDGRMALANPGTIHAAVEETVCRHVAIHERMRGDGV